MNPAEEANKKFRGQVNVYIAEASFESALLCCHEREAQPARGR